MSALRFAKLKNQGKKISKEVIVTAVETISRLGNVCFHIIVVSKYCLNRGGWGLSNDT